MLLTGTAEDVTSERTFYITCSEETVAAHLRPRGVWTVNHKTDSFLLPSVDLTACRRLNYNRPSKKLTNNIPGEPCYENRNT